MPLVATSIYLGDPINTPQDPFTSTLDDDPEAPPTCSTPTSGHAHRCLASALPHIFAAELTNKLNRIAHRRDMYTRAAARWPAGHPSKMMDRQMVAMMASHKKQQSRARLAMAKQGARVGTPAEPVADDESKTSSASSDPSGGDTNTADNVTEKTVGMSDPRPRSYGPDDYIFNDDTDLTGSIPPMSSQLPEPYHFDPGFHMSTRRDPNDLSGRTNFRGTRGTRFSSAHEAAADQQRRKISPYYAPVTLRGPSGEAIRCLA